jgi:iron complex outermembrane receptor protein
MRRTNDLTVWVRAVLGVAALAAAGGAQAQDDVDTVVVTGSRIRQDPLNQPAPLVTVDDADIAKSGLTSVGDLLQRLPVSGGGLNTKFNTSGNVGFPPDGGGVGAGAATADLRHLGPKRTLVLVDGIRWVNESSASGVSGATDLNTIPTSIIDHIEVLQDGASAIYGSDAIAGVINIITRKSFEGIEFAGYGGGYDEGDGDTTQFNISAGTSSDTTKAFLGLSYVEQNRVSSADREISEFPTPGLGRCSNRCSAGTPQGLFEFTDPNLGETLDLVLNDGVTNPVYIPTPAGQPRTDSFHEFTGRPDRFNFQPFNLITTPSERVGLYGQVETEMSDNVSVYVKGLFNNRKSTNQAAPEPIFVGPNAGNLFNSPLDITEVSVDNPYNPLGFTLDLTNTGSFIGRRPLEGGPRIFEQTVNTWYVGGGFRGDFSAAERDFYWDVNAVWSRNRADQTTHGSYNSLKIKNALGPGLAEAVGDPITACGEVVAGTVPNPIPGCVPFNIFGGQGDGSGTITQEMLDYIRPVLHDNSEQELKDFTANLTGTIFNLPAGGLGFAIGVEHREQEGSYEPDAIYAANESAGVPSGPTDGEFDVDEVYGEIQIPILKDAPLANLLQVSAAIRWFDYSTFGSDTTTKFGLNWRPVQDVLLRGTYGEGFRAPNIGELFGTFSRFDATIDDPCTDYAGVLGGPPKSATIQANCQALGVPNTYAQFNNQISVITGGNPALVPETSDGYTAGLVYSPRWATGASWSDALEIELTYYKIEIDDTIQARDAQAKLNGCVEALDPVLCDGITRTPAGVINGFDNVLINIGGTTTSGYDLNLRWALPETGVGRFTFTWQNTYLDEYIDQVQTAAGLVEEAREGTERGSPSIAFPELKSALTADWTLGDFAAAATVRYTDAVTETCPAAARAANNGGVVLCSSDPVENEMEATTYVDIQGSWTPAGLGGGWTFTLGINNLFDEDPPFCYTCELNSFDGSAYDIPGMFWYGRVVARFGNE